MKTSTLVLIGAGLLLALNAHRADADGYDGIDYVPSTTGANNALTNGGHRGYSTYIEGRPQVMTTVTPTPGGGATYMRSDGSGGIVTPLYNNGYQIWEY